MNPKVLVLTSTFPRWKKDSTPPFVYHCCLSVQPNYGVTVLAPHHHQARFSEKKAGLRIIRFPYFFPFRWQKLCYEGGILPNLKKSLLAKIQVPFFLAAEFFFSLRLVLKNKPDLIHAHWTIPQGIIALLLKEITQTPIVVTAHAADVFTKNRIFRKLNNLVLKRANYLTATSQATKKTLIGSNRSFKNLAIVSMGVDENKFKPPKPGLTKKIKKRLKLTDSSLILYVGRLAEKKGLTYLIQAMPLILKKQPQARLIIIGYGPQEKKLKNLALLTKVANKVSFLGKIPNTQLPQYYQAADIFVLPSIREKRGDVEGLPVVLLEAMASEKAVVTCQVGGINDLVVNLKNGLLVKERSPSQLATAVIKLLKNPKLRKRLGKRARFTILTRFSWKIIGQKFKNIYHQTLTQKDPTGKTPLLSCVV